MNTFTHGAPQQIHAPNAVIAAEQPTVRQPKMTRVREIVEAEVSFLAPGSGGRETAPVLRHYRPTCTTEAFPDEHVGIAFDDGPAEWPGWNLPFRTKLTLSFFPQPWYERWRCTAASRFRRVVESSVMGSSSRRIAVKSPNPRLQRTRSLLP